MKHLPPLVPALLATVACSGPTFVATDGKTFASAGTAGDEALAAAARESAVHDIPCKPADIRVDLHRAEAGRRSRRSERGFDRAVVVAEGCGTRLVYGTDVDDDPQLVLTDWRRVPRR